MTRDEERILLDLGKHMRKKILRNINDHVDLCLAAEIPFNDVAANLMSFFVGIAATFAQGHFNISAGEFARVMAQEFRRAEARETENEAESD